MGVAPGPVPGSRRRGPRVERGRQPPARGERGRAEGASRILERRARATRRDHACRALAREPGQLRGVPPADREPRRGRPLSRLRDAVQQRLAVLVRPRVHDPPAIAQRNRRAQLHRAARRRAALLRRADREHARGPCARFQRAARGARRPRRVDRKLSRTLRRPRRARFMRRSRICRRRFRPRSRRCCARTRGARSANT